MVGVRVAIPAGGAASVRLPDGSVVETDMGRLRVAPVLSAAPWRTVRSRRGQRHLAGRYWCATSGAHVVFESQLELARLMLADFDPAVAGIAAQPFLLTAEVDGRRRRHVPDFLLTSADGVVTVVNVKPASRLSDPAVAEALAWPGELIERHGWAYEVWSGADPVLLANVRLLASQRRPGLVGDAVLQTVLGACGGRATVRQVLGRLAGVVEPWIAKPAIVRLLWEHRLSVDIHRVLDADSVLEVC